MKPRISGEVLLNIWGLSFSKEAPRLAEVIKGIRGILERQRNSSKDKVLKQSKIYSLERKDLSLNNVRLK